MSATVRSPLARAEVARLASKVLRGEGSTLAALSVSLVGPARIRALNRRWMGRDAVTDVLAFDLGGAGDVYVCPAVAARSAGVFRCGAREELARLVVHGVLHALGHVHPEGRERTQSTMWRLQERYLAAWRRGR